MSNGMGPRCEATSQTLPNGDIRIVTVDRHEGINHRVDVMTKAEGDDMVARLSAFLDAGVQRYGSVDELARALRWRNGIAAAS